MESGIQNLDYEKSNILLISILKFGRIYRLYFGMESRIQIFFADQHFKLEIILQLYFQI